ncbi:MAG: 2OG-Fe(II) oxygenase family protein [Actinomycetota bacterium]
MQPDAPNFGAAREAELAAEAASWDTSAPGSATADDVPVVDVAAWLRTGDARELRRLGDQVRHIGEELGFHLLVGHGIAPALFQRMFDAAAAFLSMEESDKRTIVMDQPDAPVNGIGWLPPKERRLPTRSKGNLNEAILFKQDRDHRLAHNLWPDPALVPDFRSTVEEYAAEIERVALGLVPVYAAALDLPGDYFDDAFASPFWRLRMTRYHPTDAADADEFGIAPHVDTTFFTLLAQSGPGLVIHSPRRDRWLEVPLVRDALVVNTGELLKQWSNDRFLSVKHFVPPHRGPGDRYSVPFFFNATADHPMACLPTCHGPDNPPRYPTVSYLESQAAAQRE